MPATFAYGIAGRLRRTVPRDARASGRPGNPPLRRVAAKRLQAAFPPPAKGFPENPNGSLNDIAGICDESGRIFGLMPHPEAFLSPFNAPDWQTKKLEGRLPEWGEGRIIFENAVEFAASCL